MEKTIRLPVPTKKITSFLGLTVLLSALSIPVFATDREDAACPDAGQLSLTDQEKILSCIDGKWRLAATPGQILVDVQVMAGGRVVTASRQLLDDGQPVRVAGADLRLTAKLVREDAILLEVVMTDADQPAVFHQMASLKDGDTLFLSEVFGREVRIVVLKIR